MMQNLHIYFLMYLTSLLFLGCSQENNTGETVNTLSKVEEEVYQEIQVIRDKVFSLEGVEE